MKPALTPREVVSTMVRVEEDRARGVWRVLVEDYQASIPCYEASGHYEADDVANDLRGVLARLVAQVRAERD